ncbi:MAG TPA: hypothetical protein P5060_01775 [Candidatus Absconditabacterales bacterium]|nr:hypothetical protein [Candidatus Absconditabacterales bacterium]
MKNVVFFIVLFFVFFLSCNGLDKQYPLENEKIHLVSQEENIFESGFIDSIEEVASFDSNLFITRDSNSFVVVKHFTDYFYTVGFMEEGCFVQVEDFDYFNDDFFAFHQVDQNQAMDTVRKILD